MPRTRISKEEGGGFRVTVRPNSKFEQPMVTRKFKTAHEVKEGIAAVLEEHLTKRAALQQKRLETPVQ